MHKLLPALMLLGTTLHATAQTGKQLKNADIIIRHANVITMQDGLPLTDRVVCISKNRITYIGPDKQSGELQTNAQIVNANGGYLMPGMAEMHVHLPQPEEQKKFFTLSLMGGVTTIRSMRGKPQHLDLKKPLGYPIPHMYLGAPIITRFTPLDEKSADSILHAYSTAGYDFIKVLDIKDSASFITLMKYARRYKLPVCGHMLYNLSLECLLNNGYSTIEHMGGYVDAAKKGQVYLNNILELTKANHIYQCPTEDWYSVYNQQVDETALKQRAGLQYIHDTVKAQWDKSIADTRAKMGDSALTAMREKYAQIHRTKIDIIRQMAAMNIMLLIGADGGEDYMVPGFTMVDEMNIFQEAGLNNYHILQCATINAAKYMQQDKDWGTVETGKQANLVLLAANPLEDLHAVTQVKGVFLDNKYLPQKELEASLNP